MELTIRPLADEWIDEWCQRHGWTEWMWLNQWYWAFPPNGVIPEPLPREALRLLKRQKGWSQQERGLTLGAVSVALGSALASYGLHCPLPLVLAFGICAVVSIQLEEAAL